MTLNRIVYIALILSLFLLILAISVGYVRIDEGGFTEYFYYGRSLIGVVFRYFILFVNAVGALTGLAVGIKSFFKKEWLKGFLFLFMVAIFIFLAFYSGPMSGIVKPYSWSAHPPDAIYPL